MIVCVFQVLATAAAIIGGVYFMVYAKEARKLLGLIPICVCGLGYATPFTVALFDRQAVGWSVYVGIAIMIGAGVIGARLYAIARAEKMRVVSSPDED